MQSNTTEQQKITELMKPRVIVENLWPRCEFGVGDIFTLVDNRIGGEMYVDDPNSGDPSYMLKKDVEPFPYLMRPLKWYEEREFNEMTEYVKHKMFPLEYVEKIVSHFHGIFYTDSGAIAFIKDDERFIFNGKHRDDEGYYRDFIPCTSQEYSDYINSKKDKA